MGMTRTLGVGCTGVKVGLYNYQRWRRHPMWLDAKFLIILGDNNFGSAFALSCIVKTGLWSGSRTKNCSKQVLSLVTWWLRMSVEYFCSRTIYISKSVQSYLWVSFNADSCSHPIDSIQSFVFIFIGIFMLWINFLWGGLFPRRCARASWGMLVSVNFGRSRWITAVQKRFVPLATNLSLALRYLCFFFLWLLLPVIYFQTIF